MRNSQKAFTLIEMVMVMVVVGALSGGVIVFVTQGLDIWNFITFRNDESAQGRVAMDRTVREIRQIMDKSSVDIANSTDLKFTDVDSNSIEFSLSGTNLMRNTDILCEGVSNLEFKYYDVANDELTSPKVLPDETDIRMIKINLTVTSGDQSITLKSQVYPRNF